MLHRWQENDHVLSGTNFDLHQALTRFNYFPNQRADSSEIPPALNSRTFTPAVSQELASEAETTERTHSAYDLVEYRATRYNNVPRTLSIPHPKAYSLLATEIVAHWDKIDFITNSIHSQIIPASHVDGRTIVMNYSDPTETLKKQHQYSFGKNFRVHADISNCFNSIYSHSIGWAAVGRDEAKRTSRDHSAWYNRLDKYCRRTKRNETNGVPIGPATSNIIVEFILQNIDKTLSDLGFQFYRHIDDYTCFCESNEKAHQFIHHLGNQLSEYKLTLNLKKTKVVSLPSTNDETWILDLHSISPKRIALSEDHTIEVSTLDALKFINKAIEINAHTPDGSVIKYALKALLPHLTQKTSAEIIDAILDVCWHYPISCSILDNVLDKSEIDVSIVQEKIEEIIRKNSQLYRSDGSSWGIYLLSKHQLEISKQSAEDIILSQDCVAITLLSMFDSHQEMAVDFGKNLLQKDIHIKDNYWILLYQLYLKGHIDNPYPDETTFEILRQNDVDFMPGDTTTNAEESCRQQSFDLIFSDFF